jgi:crotonobetainyl-CoA:carnitine CoA-transferase CaiB-like acyl-CoA transferase
MNSLPRFTQLAYARGRARVIPRTGGKERTMRHPLDGITVVTLEQAVAAPFATRQLADLGARVIKVERPPAGDFARGYDRTVHGQSSYFVWLNRGKESVVLDVKDAADRAVLDAMISRADVFVQNLIPGAAERLGLDAATVRAALPRLIHCSISGYGDGGPYGAKKAYDLLVQCETGLVMSTGTRRRRPRPASPSPTSRPGCTPTAASWPRCTTGSGPARARRCASPCSTRSAS